MTSEITIHTMKISGRQSIEYARILMLQVRKIVGRTVPLNRLSREQLKQARRVSKRRPR